MQWSRRATTLKVSSPVDYGQGMNPNSIDPLVSPRWLAEHLADEDLIVLDCTVFLHPTEGGFRAVSGRTDFDRVHLPGARFADLVDDLCDAASPLRFAIPSPEHFATAMGRLGVGDDTRVVLYDNNRSMWAARVWWMLKNNFQAMRLSKPRHPRMDSHTCRPQEKTSPTWGKSYFRW